jgi:hypothetical protein
VFIHGCSNTPVYKLWVGMIQRCTNPTANHWSCYGGANPPVRVCDRWRTSFESFLEDIGERPAGTSLGRYGDINNYSCGHCEQCKQSGWELNCAWQTPKQQAAEQKLKRQLKLAVAA